MKLVLKKKRVKNEILRMISKNKTRLLTIFTTVKRRFFLYLGLANPNSLPLI